MRDAADEVVLFDYEGNEVARGKTDREAREEAREKYRAEGHANATQKALRLKRKPDQK